MKRGLRALAALLLLALAMTACAEGSDQAARAGEEALNENFESAQPRGEENAMTLTIGDRAFSVTLEDNETAAAFAALLPMELAMSELNGNEKYHYLMGDLPARSERVGHIEVGDLMLYGSDCVVLFYKSFNTPYSYTRIGKLDDVAGLEEAVGRGNITVEMTR